MVYESIAGSFRNFKNDVYIITVLVVADVLTAVTKCPFPEIELVLPKIVC